MWQNRDRGGGRKRKAGSGVPVSVSINSVIVGNFVNYWPIVRLARFANFSTNFSYSSDLLANDNINQADPVFLLYREIKHARIFPSIYIACAIRGNRFEREKK